MTTSFERYASYYDKLYGDKDYEQECDFIEDVFKRFSRIPVRSVLDVGCGTGGHLIPLAVRGSQLTGVDSSESMLAIARRKLRARGSQASIHHADARSFDLGQVFDAVICMFAVLGYILDNDGIAATFGNIRRHLKSGGIFIMDFWYGPAVLKIRPSTRVLKRQSDGLTLVRVASPFLDTVSQTVRIHYDLWAVDGSVLIDRIEEDHVMRFFFAQEIRHFMDEAGLEWLGIHPFADLDKEISENDWNGVVVGRAR